MISVSGKIWAGKQNTFKDLQNLIFIGNRRAGKYQLRGQPGQKAAGLLGGGVATAYGSLDPWK